MSTRQASIFTMLILIAVLMLSGAATAQVGASQTTDGTVHSLPDDHNQGEWVEFTHTLGPDPQTLHPVKMYSQNYSTLWGLEKNATAFGQGTASNYMFGDGSDGDLTVASGQTYYTDDTRSALAASASADQSNITLSNAVGFAVGHEVLVIQMQGTGAGNYEFGTIAAINGNTLTLQRKLTNAYTVGGNDKAQIIRVLQYRNVTVQSGGILTAHAWDGTTGGVICFRVSELFEVQSGGSINVIGIGFRGGLASTVNVDGYAFRGEGSNQLYNATKYYTNNLDAAGGGENEINSNIRQTGGGGGGYGTPGINGTKHNLGNGNVGQGGGVFGAPDLSIIFLGAGGGGGGSNWQQSPPPTAKGGNGGGIVMLFANDMVVYGAINATGSNGETVLSDTGDGGGGAGGSILIKTRTANLGSNNLTANGGLGGTGGPGAFGGNGGEGRIRFEYCDTFSGSTNPPASVAKINCYGTVAGKVFRDDNGNGAQDAGEPGLASVTVSLSGVGQTATGGDGSYSFTANAPANYTVSATPPAGYNCTTPCNVDIALQVDQTTTVNFGLRSPRVYLPLVLRDYVAYFEGPWEVEPNNTYLQANGSLRSGQYYYGYPNDQKDYFSIYLRTGGQIVIDLSNHTGQGVQLQLFYQTAGNLVAGDLDAPYHIEYTGPAGLYYIYIYTAGNYNSNTAYTLRVTYP